MKFLWLPRDAQLTLQVCFHSKKRFLLVPKCFGLAVCSSVGAVIDTRRLISAESDNFVLQDWMFKGIVPLWCYDFWITVFWKPVLLTHRKRQQLKVTKVTREWSEGGEEGGGNSGEENEVNQQKNKLRWLAEGTGKQGGANKGDKDQVWKKIGGWKYSPHLHK